jgi:hypothetical protein
MEYFVHKFRATIGKNKILDKDENVLFAYSSSSASVAMLNLIYNVNLSSRINNLYLSTRLQYLVI